MKVLIFLCLSLVTAITAIPAPPPKGLTDEMIDYINSAQTSWKAGKNFKEGTTLEDVKKLLGVKIGDRTGHKIKTLEVSADLPTEFDARTKWPACTSIGEIRDQASCGSCWAFGAVEAITDRYCIASGGKVTPHISAEDLNDCCIACGAGCNGGDPATAWRWWVQTGIVTGGNYNSGEGCEPYTIASCDHHVNGTLAPCGGEQPTPTCTRECISGYTKPYAEDKWFGNDSYGIVQNVGQIQQELFDNGPMEVDFSVFDDFFSYKSGVYYHKAGTYQGGHAVKLIGWGVDNTDPNATDYWLIANSWNSEWGDKGFFKIRRGNNECGIEADVQSGSPRLA